MKNPALRLVACCVVIATLGACSLTYEHGRYADVVRADIVHVDGGADTAIDGVGPDATTDVVIDDVTSDGIAMDGVPPDEITLDVILEDVVPLDAPHGCTSDALCDVTRVDVIVDDVTPLDAPTVEVIAVDVSHDVSTVCHSDLDCPTSASLCCAGTGMCYASSCTSCCPTSGGEGGTSDAIVDATARTCASSTDCLTGESCCLSTGTCYASSCLACCPATTDCTIVPCSVGQSCCPSTHACYPTTCLACCTP